MQKLMKIYVKNYWKAILTLSIIVLIDIFLFPLMMKYPTNFGMIFSISSLTILNMTLMILFIKTINYDDIFDKQKQLLFTSPFSTKQIVGSRIILSSLSFLYIIVLGLLSFLLFWLSNNLFYIYKDFVSSFDAFFGIFFYPLLADNTSIIIYAPLSLLIYLDINIFFLLIFTLENTKKFKKILKKNSTIFTIILIFTIITIFSIFISSLARIINFSLLSIIIQFILAISFIILGYLLICYNLDYYLEM